MPYLIFDNNKNTLVYYPVPKNANTSAKLFFAMHLGVDDKYVFLGDTIPRYLQKKQDFKGKKNLVNFFIYNKQKFEIVNADIKCCIVRDPIKRFISTFQNRIIYHKDNEFKNHTVDEVLNKLLENKFENKHFLPQSYFLGNSLDYYSFYCDITNIEFFQKKINEFFGKNLKFPMIQTNKGQIQKKLNQEQIYKIKIIYEQDYNLLKLKK